MPPVFVLAACRGRLVHPERVYALRAARVLRLDADECPRKSRQARRDAPKPMTPTRKDGAPWEACCLCRYLTDGLWEGVPEGAQYCWLDLQIVDPTLGHCKAFVECDSFVIDTAPLNISAHDKAGALALKGNTYHEEPV